MNSEQTQPQENSEVETDLKKDANRPGSLRGQVWLTIQTRQAQQFIRGRKGTADKSAIIGLTGFADRLRVIWLAARNDDPYADWWLIKIHEAIDSSSTYIRDWQSELDSQLDQVTGLEVTIAGSQKPYRVPLQFANPYAYQAARLLSEYDTLVCTVLTARHIGLQDNKASEGLLRLCGRKIRSTFVIPQGYKFLQIDRAILSQGGEKSINARKAMGEVPEDILSGERHAPLVPRKVQFPTGFAENVALHPSSPESNTHLLEDKNTSA